MKKQRNRDDEFTSSLDHVLVSGSSERATTRLGVTAAVLVHVVLFVANWPSIVRSEPESPEKQAPIHVLRQFEITLPPPPPPDVEVKLPQRSIPVPDPDPFDPEPVNHEGPPADIDFDPSLIVRESFVVPDPPPDVEESLPLVGAQVTAPRKIVTVKPIYPEPAMKVRLEGVVVLSLVIGKTGRVESVEVLRPQPLGMSEAAVEAARQWVFEPSTLNGRPTAIQYILTVRFDLL